MATWPGYENICECQLYSSVGYCSDSDLKSGCKDSGKFDPVELSNWDGRKMCLRKSSNNIIQYYDESGFIEVKNNDWACPSDSKKCLLSSQGNFVCVSRFDLCPLTRIEIKDRANLDPNRTRWKYEYDFDNKKLMFDNSASIGLVFTSIMLQYEDCEELQDLV